ncbi:MAG: NAD-binding protein [Pseudomonadota bacterium]|nr:NAD-binding protein [Pseudomonadota bacterium]
MSSLFRLKDWLVIGPLTIAAFALSIWGFLDCGRVCGNPGIGQSVMQSFGLVLGHARFKPNDVIPLQLSLAQFLVPAIALIGAGKLFLLNLRRDLRVALARRARHHVIVCGLGEVGRQMVESLREAGRTAIAITLDSDDGNTLACEQLGATVLRANVHQRNILELAGIRHADAIIATTGSDAQNLEIGLRAAEAAGGRSGQPLKIVAEMRSDWLMDNLLNHRTAVLGGTGTEFQIFNLRANAARALLRSAAFERTLVRAGENPHIVLAGTGALAVEVMRRAICSNFALPGVKLAVSAFGREVPGDGELLQKPWNDLSGLADFDFHKAVFSPGDRGAWVDVAATLKARRADAVIVALADDEAALHAALQFRNTLDMFDQLATPVFVRLKEQSRLGAFLRHVEAHPLLPDRVVAFGDLHEMTAPAVLLGGELDRMARAAHEVYLASKTGGGPSPADVPWAQLPERFKSANRDLADFIPSALRVAGYRIVPDSGAPVRFDERTCEMLARAEHWRWCTEKRAHGWHYAEIRNDILKQTPLLTDWANLPEDMRRFNGSLAAQIPDIVRAAGCGIRAERVVSLPAEVSASSLPEGLADAITVLRIDPTSEAAWAVARQAVDAGARVRLVWRGADALLAIERRADAAAFADAFEGWVFA